MRTAATEIGGSGRVLVVDDDRAICELLQTLLESQGYRVRTAPDGAVALTFVHELALDLIFLDQRMPVVDGPAFAAAYHALPCPHAPIVAMTAGADARQYGREIGAQAYVGKPFRVATLLACAARLARPVTA